MNKPIVWMNGSFVDYEKATVSIEDRGFQFSDGVYEVFRFIGGRYFAFDEHLKRLRASLESVGIELKMVDGEIRKAAQTMISMLNQADATLYLQVTRGVAPRSHLHPLGMSPTILMILRGFHSHPAEHYAQGIGVILLKDERWLRCDIKSTALLANVLARNRARLAQVEDAIFTRDGLLTEGTSNNVFIIQKDELATPRADHRILHGITRAYVLKVARSSGMRVSERDVSVIELKEANEVFLTSTTLEIMPVVKIDHFPVGKGIVGELTKRLMDAYGKVLHGAG